MFASLHASPAELPGPHLRRVLLAPTTQTAVARHFVRTSHSSSRHKKLLTNLQRFRGSNYLSDGAIQAHDLSADGRHIEAIDLDSWHLLTLDGDEQILSCARYHENYNPSFESTVAASCALAYHPLWQASLRSAVSSAIHSARSRKMRFAELGGWCVSKNCRNGSQAIRTVLSMYALGEILGGTVGLSTATMRHASSAILQKLGGSRLEDAGQPLPTYIEPKYQCEMQLLQFDTSKPASRYAETISGLSGEMRSSVEVLTASSQLSVTQSLISLSNAVGTRQLALLAS